MLLSDPHIHTLKGGTTLQGQEREPEQVTQKELPEVMMGLLQKTGSGS